MKIDGRAHPTIAIEAARRGTTTAVRCTGAWTVHGLAQLEHQLDALSWPDGELVVDGSAMSALDTSGAWLLHRTIRALEQGGHKIGLQGLRPEFSSLLRLIGSREVAAQAPAMAMPGPVARLGQRVWSDAIGMTGYLSFVGESFTVLVRSLAHPQRLRWRPILHNLQSAGVEALPITGLLSFLLGIVIAYQGADQLQRFGANIFIADLVGLAMLRELSPLLTAIIVAGRSGSAYTAQIGTMKVTEEIDALRTIGVAPQELLVAAQDAGAGHRAAAAHRLYRRHRRTRRHDHGAAKLDVSFGVLPRPPRRGDQPFLVL